MNKRLRPRVEFICSDNLDRSMDFYVGVRRYRYFFHGSPDDILAHYRNMAKYSPWRAFNWVKGRAYRYEVIAPII